ncbi:MAG: UDP-N-acetylmuramoyl-tripeptide--D-alanyl-D-alanine ligase [Candidatus Firestonebacteria bacterium]|nr:UDP-N-acetylmuramoyl-tripeptide--D-alanyl-D-alanine ligase [Candidatus Firestonebacteria bacterium]
MEYFNVMWLEDVLKIKTIFTNNKSVQIKNLWINGVSTDTRTLKEGELFIALCGENFDGHNYIEDARLKGACGAIVRKSGFRIHESEVTKKKDFFLIEVEDTLKSLQEISKAYRKKLNLVMVNITGSNGKTTTKEMVYSVLSTMFKTYKSEGNFNNEIGVPRALLSLDKTYDAAVLELGMTHKGDIKCLVELTIPQVRVLTNIGPAHLENFSGLEEIAQGKAEIFDFYKEGDTAVINIDDAFVKKFGDTFPGEKITYSLKEDADVVAKEIENSSFTLLIYGKDKIRVTLPVFGRHNIYNALCAACVGVNRKVPIENIAKALGSFTPPEGRLELHKFNNIWIINDTYNANPISMKSALESFNQINHGKQKILVLGDMLELGKKEVDFHVEIGKEIASMKINYLFTCGRLARYIAESAIINGMLSENILIFQNYLESGDKIFNILSGDDLILLKGSHSMKMETIFNYLKEKLE